tara:strand:- start:93 stop:473 length:381 start_codon:yes stop_codon:yes gene_type:complete
VKKLILLLLFIPLVSFGQLTYEEKNILAAEIFETFSEDYIKKSLFILVKLDEKAVIAAANKCLNDNDWEAQRDCEREIERTDRLAWYKKQKWWKKIKENEDVAYFIRAKIIRWADERWLENYLQSR